MTSGRLAAAAAVLLALALLVPNTVAVPVTTCPKLNSQTTAGYTFLTKARGLSGARYGDFLAAVTKCKLSDLLKKASAGKVILVPTGWALEEKFLKCGIRNKNIPHNCCKAFQNYITAKLVVDQSKIPSGAGCSSIMRTNSVSQPLRKLINDTPAKKSFSAARDPYGTISPYSVLGVGYNMYKGFPLSAGLAAMDPGFTLVPLFQLTDPYVSAMSPTGGACETHFSTSTSYSTDENKRNIQASLEINAKGGTAAKFALSLSGNFQMINNDMSTGSTTSTMSSAKVYLGAYALRGRPPLDDGFVQTIRDIAASDNIYANTDALTGLVDQFGTHYVNRVYYGGLASMIFTMSTSAKAKLDNLSVNGSLSGSIEGPGGMAGLSIKGSGGYDSSQNSGMGSSAQSFAMVLMPSNVPLVLATAGGQNSAGSNVTNTYIDCQGWSDKIQTAFDEKSWQAPISYGFGTISSLLSMTSLFPNDGTREKLPTIQAALKKYIDSCAYSDPTSLGQFSSQTTGSCPVSTSDTCAQGSYKTVPKNANETTGCQSCFSSPNAPAFGPNCNFEKVGTCDATTCFCDKNWYAKQPAGTNDPDCTPLP